MIPTQAMPGINRCVEHRVSVHCSLIDTQDRRGGIDPLGPGLHSFMPVNHRLQVPALESILIYLWVHKARERK